MERQEAIEQIRRNWRPILERMGGKAKEQMNGEDSYICPLCGHGKGGDGVTYNRESRDGNSLKCFGCGYSGDIIDLYQKVNGTDFNTSLEELSQQIGIEIDREGPQKAESRRDGKEVNQDGRSSQRAVIKRGREYYKVCTEALSKDKEAISYLEGRGISLKTALSHGLGYDSAWRSPTALEKGKNPPSSKRIIIPTSINHYFARAIEKPSNDSEKRYQKMNEGEAGLFNLNCLHDDTEKAVFIVEGAIDAMSIEEVGGLALALNSTSNVRMLIAALETRPTRKTLILCLDNDKAGREATVKLREGLKSLNISFVTADICNGCKDANEALQKNRAEFMALVDKAQYQTTARPDNTLAYMETMFASDLDEYKAGCNIKTGFNNLDEESKGVFNGLYAIAAISSLGKTTFACQLMDNFARSGREVVYFSLEQSTLEIFTKSLARITAQRDMKTAVTSLSIRCGNMGDNVTKAIEEYREAIGQRVSVIEGNFGCTSEYIGDYVRQYINKTGTRPIVFVDYLQIVQDEDDRRGSTKETIDHVVTSLKRLSRDLKITIFVICSVNRSNYLTPVDFESIKESGAIEYTADAIWGLQLRCLSEAVFSQEKGIKEKRERVRQAKSENPRKIELLCLKNRNGKSSFSCYFDYYPANDLFVEADTNPEDDDDSFPDERKSFRK